MGLRPLFQYKAKKKTHIHTQHKHKDPSDALEELNFVVAQRREPSLG